MKSQSEPLRHAELVLALSARLPYYPDEMTTETTMRKHRGFMRALSRACSRHICGSGFLSYANLLLDLLFANTNGHVVLIIDLYPPESAGDGADSGMS